MGFKIISNKLKRETEIKSLKVENNNYKIIIFYEGEYKRGKCDKNKISISCKPKTDVFELIYMNGNVYINIQYNPILKPEEIDAFEKSINVSKEDAIDLQKLIDEIFIG